MLCYLIRGGLRCLGLDPATAKMVVDNEERVRQTLAALPPPDADADLPEPEPLPPAPEDERRRRKVKAQFDRMVERYRDPAEPPPDIARESFTVIWAYVLARDPSWSARREALRDAMRKVTANSARIATTPADEKSAAL